MHFHLWADDSPQDFATHHTATDNLGDIKRPRYFANRILAAAQKPDVYR